MYPGTKISTLRELFEFAECADPHHRILWNIESKINPLTPEATHDVDDFVTKQHAEFLASGYIPSQITVSILSIQWYCYLHDGEVSKLWLAHTCGVEGTVSSVMPASNVLAQRIIRLWMIDFQHRLSYASELTTHCRIRISVTKHTSQRVSTFRCWWKATMAGRFSPRRFLRLDDGHPDCECR